MIERAEREGRLRPGDTIVEASSGNTGNAMSMVAAVKGYRMLVVMPEGMSPERLAISRAFGAEVLTIGDFHVTQALEKAASSASRPGFFSPQQFDSEWNVDENREWLGPELLRQLPDGVVPDAIVAGVGTGGTLIGVGQAVRAVNPACRHRRRAERVLHAHVRRGREAPDRGHQRRVRPRDHRAPSRPDRRPRPGRQRCLDRRDAAAGARARPVRRPELRGQPGRGAEHGATPIRRRARS